MTQKKAKPKFVQVSKETYETVDRVAKERGVSVPRLVKELIDGLKDKGPTTDTVLVTLSIPRDLLGDEVKLKGWLTPRFGYILGKLGRTGL